MEYPPRDGSKLSAEKNLAPNAALPLRYPFTLHALLVFQDEHARESELSGLLKSGAMNWYGGHDDPVGGYTEDWQSIANFKYETVEFVWLDEQNVLLRQLNAFAPKSCIGPKAPDPPGFKCGSSDIISNEVGAFNNQSPPPLGHDSFFYKVAESLVKARRPPTHLP